jgi:hypothetical protein
MKKKIQIQDMHYILGHISESLEKIFGNKKDFQGNSCLPDLMVPPFRRQFAAESKINVADP